MPIANRLAILKGPESLDRVWRRCTQCPPDFEGVLHIMFRRLRVIRTDTPPDSPLNRPVHALGYFQLARQNPGPNENVNAAVVLELLPRDAVFCKLRQPDSVDLHGTQIRRTIAVAYSLSHTPPFDLENRLDE